MDACAVNLMRPAIYGAYHHPSVFFVSLEDDLMRLFSSDRIAGVMDKLGFKEGEMIEHSMISKVCALLSHLHSKLYLSSVT